MQRITATDSAAYSRANCAVATKSVLRRTALALEKYDLPFLLLDTAQTRTNTGWKPWHTSKNSCVTSASLGCYLDAQHDFTLLRTKEMHCKPSMRERSPLFQTELFVVGDASTVYSASPSSSTT